MMVYRIAREAYAHSLMASGVANRWNREHEYVIYCSINLSLCALGLLAHTAGVRPAGAFKVMVISIQEPFSMKLVEPDDLPRDWISLSYYSKTQAIGSRWYGRREELALKVPSAVIPKESNIALNTTHLDFETTVSLADVEDFFWDKRFPGGKSID